MTAVIATCGRQYRVSEGQVFKCEKLDAEPGQKVIFDQVLMVGEGENVQMGAPYVEGAAVEVEVIEQGRAKKIEIIKFKRRKHHMKRAGHRQYLTEVKVIEIKGAGGVVSAKPKAAAAPAKAKPAAEKKVKAAEKKVESTTTAKAKKEAKPAEQKAKPASKASTETKKKASPEETSTKKTEE